LFIFVHNIGITTAPSHSDAPLENVIGTSSSTMEKKNQKKRAKKVVSPDAVTLNNKINPNIDAFYTKFVGNKYYIATAKYVFYLQLFPFSIVLLIFFYL
jgi:hypothetical protein